MVYNIIKQKVMKNMTDLDEPMIIVNVLSKFFKLILN